MVVKPEIMEELYMDAGVDRIERAREYVRAKRVQITKVIYENKSNFEIRSKVRGSGEIYDVYIKVENGEIVLDPDNKYDKEWYENDEDYLCIVESGK